MVSGGLIAKKQEMTKVWVDGKNIPVTMLVVPQQEVLQWKNVEKDGYTSVVIGAEKKELNKEKGRKVSYAYITEFAGLEQVDGWMPSVDQLQDVASVKVTAISQGKGFQGVMKRYNFGGGPATHGSKFHRAAGSTGNRKPRRTIKGQKMAGRMGNDRITLRSVPVVDVLNNGSETIILLKGSIPGSYNSFVKLSIV